MEYYARQMKLDPLLAQKARDIAATKIKELSKNPAIANRPTGNQAVTVIPIVFHIVGTAANQAFASDEMIRRQVDVLNRDFAGLNPDSTKLPAAFKALFAHSNIRFALAKRTPVATPTNGIERRITPQTFTVDTYNSSLKHAASGGLDQWDGLKYLNVWVADFSDNVLGIATFPNVDPANEQGIAIHYGALDQPCGGPYTGDFDGGRTLVHEAGHYFYLFHIWGDDGGSCNSSDFTTPYGSLPSVCEDDTPNQASATLGCLTGVHSDACSANAPGIMYQNYMDYTKDACYGMFTIGQACRAEATLDLYRSSLKTSDGLVPVPGNEVNNDLRISEILNPNSRGYACGMFTTMCSIPLNPQVMVVNDGDATITTFLLEIKIDGVTVGTQVWTGNLQPGDFAYITLAGINATAGKHILTIKTINPNGLPDTRLASDSATAAFTLLSAGAPAAMGTESFEGSIFPPAGWRVDNANPGSITWEQTMLAGNTGNASVRMNGFSYSDTGEVDYLVSPKLSTVDYDTLLVSFNLAYAKYSESPYDWEIVELVYSEDCGVTWKPTGYSKTGSQLATNGGGLVTSSFMPTIGEWRTDTVKIPLCGIAPNITIAFKSTNRYGNNLYLDDIDFSKLNLPDPNVAINQVIDPDGLYCDGNIQPRVRIFNNGTSLLTSVVLSYSIDGGPLSIYKWTGNLAKCGAPLTVSLPALNVPAGNHVFTVVASNPNGSADINPADDTARSGFSVSAIVNAPVSEDFESPAFPPLNWAVDNLDNSNTWMRTTVAAKSGAASMVIDNYSYTSKNTIDKFVSPRIVLGKPDSAFVSFDYTYRQRVQSNLPKPSDTLELIFTTDCGATTATIWKKWGKDLQTQNDSTYSNSNPFIPLLPAHWKSERIDILPLINAAPDFQVYFIAKGNQQNNLYLDNINISGKNLPVRLKSQGYLIYPNPFTSSFRIHHLIAPMDLQYVTVYNAAGQLVWGKKFNSNAPTEILVDIGRMAKGVYVLKMIYSDRTIVEKIVRN
jgi:hypothetical protein